MKQIFHISEKLVSEQSDEISGVKTINWENSSWKMAFSKGESPATRAGFGTSRGAPRPLEARTSVCWSTQSAPSTFVARGIPCRSFHQGCEVASCFTHIGTRGFRRESCIGGFSSEGASASHRTTSGRAGEADNTVHRTCQEAPLKRFRVGPVGPGLAFSMFEGVGRSRRTSGAPSNRGGSTDGRSCRDRLGSGGQGIAASRLWSWRVNASLLC